MSKDSKDINIRLVPTYLLDDMPVPPTHHTESGMFNLTTYLVPVSIKKGMVDLNTGKMMESVDNLYALYAHIHWMGEVIQKHMVLITDKGSVNHDCFSIDGGVAHSQTIHDCFGTYMEGLSEIFPSFRAFGWAFVPYNEVIAIQMWEQRAIQTVIRDGVFDFDNMVDWAMYLGITNDDEGEDEQLGEVNWIATKDEDEEVDNPDPIGVNLNSNVMSFLDQLEHEGRINDEDDTGIE